MVSNLPRFGVLPFGMLCIGVTLIAGCGSTASEEELGEVHHYLPRIDGMEVRYHLPPQMQAKTPLEGNATAAAHSTAPANEASDVEEPPFDTTETPDAPTTQQEPSPAPATNSDSTQSHPGKAADEVPLSTNEPTEPENSSTP